MPVCKKNKAITLPLQSPSCLNKGSDVELVVVALLESCSLIRSQSCSASAQSYRTVHGSEAVMSSQQTAEEKSQRDLVIALSVSSYNANNQFHINFQFLLLPDPSHRALTMNET